MDSKELVFLRKPAYTCSLDFYCLYYFLEEKQNSLLKMVLHLLEKWFKISLSFQHLQTRKEQHHSHRTIQSTIGHTGWYGVWQLRSLSETFPEEEQFVRPFLEDVFGVGSTIVSFIVLGNYSLGKQISGQMDFIAAYEKTGDLYTMIIGVIRSLPCAPFVLALVLITMIAFYATSFDSIALTASCYSYHRLGEDENPNRLIQLMWCILLILLPIALVFSESSMSNLQSVSIIAAFPIGAVIVLIVLSFMKDAKKFMEENEKQRKK